MTLRAFRSLLFAVLCGIGVVLAGCDSNGGGGGDAGATTFDVTGQVMLYDAGTEGDQEPGVGLDQAPRQSSLDTGPSGEGTLTQVTGGSNDGFSYPSTGSVISVSVSPQ